MDMIGELLGGKVFIIREVKCGSSSKIVSVVFSYHFQVGWYPVQLEEP